MITCPMCQSKDVSVTFEKNIYVAQDLDCCTEVYDNVNTGCECRDCNTRFYLEIENESI